MIGFYSAGAMGSGDVGPWTPGNLSPFAWWNDESNLVIASGNRAMSWQNIGSTAYPLEAAAESSSPTVNASGLNARRTLTLASSNRMRNNDPGALRNIYQNQNAGWAFAVVRRRTLDDSAISRSLFVVTAGAGYGSGSRFVASLGQGAANTPALFARRTDGDGTSILNASTSIGTSWALVLWVMDWSSGAGYVYVNGELSAVNASLTSAGSTSDTQSERAVFLGGFPLNVGGGSGIEGAVDADLAELVVARDLIGSTDIDRIFGYAAHRWGLAGNLDAGHPYKSAPP